MESSVEPRFTEAFAFLGQREIRVAANEFAFKSKEPAVSDRLFADVIHSPSALSSAYSSSKSMMVRHIDLSWNTLEPSLVLMYQKLIDLGWVYYNGEIHIVEPETEESQHHV